MKVYKSKTHLVLAVSYYMSGAIFGPLIFFGAGGWFADRHYGTKPLWLLVGLGIAFVVSNVLIVKQASRISKLFAQDKHHKNIKT